MYAASGRQCAEASYKDGARTTPTTRGARRGGEWAAAIGALVSRKLKHSVDAQAGLQDM